MSDYPGATDHDLTFAHLVAIRVWLDWYRCVTPTSIPKPVIPWYRLLTLLRLLAQPDYSRNASLQPSTTHTVSSNLRDVASQGSLHASSRSALHNIGPYTKTGLGDGFTNLSTIYSTSASLRPLTTTQDGNEEGASTGNDLPTTATVITWAPDEDAPDSVPPRANRSGFDIVSPSSKSSLFELTTARNISMAETLRSSTSAISNQSATTNNLKPSLTKPPHYTTIDSSNSTENTSISTVSNSGSTKDIQSAYTCYLSSGAWSASSAGFAWANMLTYSETLSNVLCPTSANPSATDIYTLCDGIPRVRNSQFDHQYCVTSPFTITFSSATKTFPSSPPACSIPKSDCDAILENGIENLIYGEPCNQQETQCFVHQPFSLVCHEVC